MVSRGRVAAGSSLAGRDRRRFRHAQCDARIRIQSCPHPVGECHVPSVLPAPDDAAGTPSLRQPDRGYLSDRILGETPGPIPEAMLPDKFGTFNGKGDLCT